MLLIEYVGHIGLRSLTDGHLGRHLEYFKTLNDAKVASLGFIKFRVILVFYRTIINSIENSLNPGPANQDPHCFPYSKLF